MKIRAIIVDDEKDARESLQLMIEKFYSEEVGIIDSVSSVKEAVKSIGLNSPDLVFLDIEMPNENAFSFLIISEKTMILKLFL
jgi:two-component system, LytTR family, response regulator